MKILKSQPQSKHEPYKRMVFDEVTGVIVQATDNTPSTREDFNLIAQLVRLSTPTEGAYVGFQCGTLLIKCKNTTEAKEALAVRMEKTASRAYNAMIKSPIPAPAYTDPSHFPLSTLAPRFKVVKLTDKTREGILIETCEEEAPQVTKAAVKTPRKQKEEKTVASLQCREPVEDNITTEYVPIDFLAFDTQYKIPSLKTGAYL